MTHIWVCLIGGVVAVSAMAQTAREIRGPAPLLAIASEPPPKIVIDPPLAESLALIRRTVSLIAVSSR
jgi:hypothetical protein